MHINYKRPLNNQGNEEKVVEIIQEEDFRKDPDAKSSPIAPEEIAEQMGIRLGEANKFQLLRAFYDACKSFEQAYGRSIILKTISISHARGDILLPFPRIRSIRKVELKSGRSWKIVYTAKSNQYDEEFLNIAEGAYSEYPSDIFTQSVEPYGMRSIILNEAVINKYCTSKKLVMRIIYTAGYCYTDKEKIPRCTLRNLIKRAKDIYYNRTDNKEQNCDPLTEEALLYPLREFK